MDQPGRRGDAGGVQEPTLVLLGRRQVDLEDGVSPSANRSARVSYPAPSTTTCGTPDASAPAKASSSQAVRARKNA